ncbi:O-antigen ligase family protein [Niabella soli]|uniref:Uncharacterized protein n=1 Tax=Niabella soli DSM 19437 TaxID=929713 RepID=W0F6T2_9BACT|nr:O-antigen ligase family protein [Niabella soli]AHF17086.1 hypothetical protein NIASO_01445 [Niabella soli DSM 19437]
MENHSLNRTFIFILLLVPLFDSMTGLLVRGDTLSAGGLGTPSQIIRFLLIGLSLLIIQSKQRYRILAIMCLYMLLIEAVAFVAHQSFQGLAIGLVFSYKFIYAAFIYFALEKIIQKEHFDEKALVRLMYKFTAILCFTFIIGDVLAIRLGISNSFFRSQGLFSSGNGLGLLLGALSFILRFGFKQRYLKGIGPKALYSLTLVCLMLIATKASVIFLVLNFIFMLWSIPSLYRSFLIIAFLVLIFIYADKILASLNIAFELLIFRFENKTSWLGFLMSGRESYLDTAFTAFKQSPFLPLRILFGAGSFLSYELPTQYTLNYKMLEMDIFDTFFIYGIIGVCLYFTFMIYCIRKSFKKSRILGWCTVTLFAHSMFAGHTLFNGLSATALVFILLLIKQGGAPTQKTSQTTYL